MGERNDTSDFPAAFGDEIMGFVPESALDDPLPARQMEKRTGCASQDKIVPRLRVFRLKRLYRDGEAGSIHAEISG